ncbi:MAG: hypothetical protein KZQ96_13645 [Candidatus Thiodiazotropha sp. (ex Lucinoma borealis)]|nr:hypothetical protein [Candidatus Thiodiazotropha sp. (ex Lucinoma borealis)]
MSNPTNTKTTESFFGEVIYSYTRAQAIEDGVLIEVGSLVKVNVFKWPVALTSAAWADCVAWSDDDSEKQVHQDQSGRLWDVLYMATYEIRNSNGSGEQMLYQLFRVPRDGEATEAEIVTLKLIVGPGDDGEPVITIMLPNED